MRVASRIKSAVRNVQYMDEFTYLRLFGTPPDCTKFDLDIYRAHAAVVLCQLTRSQLKTFFVKYDQLIPKH